MDNDTMNNIKNMVDNGDISGAISQISPEMIENFSKILNQNNNGNSNSNTSNSNNSSHTSSTSNPNHIANINNSSNSNHTNNINNSSNTNNSNNTTNSNENSNNSFNMNNLDMNTIMKITSAFNKVNNQNDPRANLLYSLKPYLRDSRKEKLDQYVNLLNVSKIAEILKDDKKENN